MAKTIGGSDGNHMKPDKHPFTGGGGKTIKPKLAHGAGAHPTAAGSVGAGKSANAAMKRK